MLEWKNEIELSGKDAIVLTRTLVYEDSNEYEYQLLHLFRLSETSSWSINGPLVDMAADNFKPEDFDGFILVEQGE